MSCVVDTFVVNTQHKLAVQAFDNSFSFCAGPRSVAFALPVDVRPTLHCCVLNNICITRYSGVFALRVPVTCRVTHHIESGNAVQAHCSLVCPKSHSLHDIPLDTVQWSAHCRSRSSSPKVGHVHIVYLGVLFLLQATSARPHTTQDSVAP